jgi:urease accessory protein
VVATMVYVAPDAAEKLDTVRASWNGQTDPPTAPSSSWPGVTRPSPHEGPCTEAAASVWNGMLVARILGPDSACVRGTVIAALDVLRDARPLPRVWLC